MRSVSINNFLSDHFFEEFTSFLVGNFWEKSSKCGLNVVSVVDLSVAIVDEVEITRINQEYRKESKSTDVLSFCYDSTDEYLEGELILCPTVIEKYAIIDEKDFLDEYAKNVFHGLLHIFGFVHGPEMFALQACLLEKIKIKDEYKKIKNQFKKRV